MSREAILIVEDDENLRLALADNLRDEGYTVDAVSTGKDAAAAIDARAYELVILDIMLPDLDGYTLARRMREAKKATRILMLTARTLEDDLVRGFEAGADDYLAKPYRLRELLARVRALLRRPPTAGSSGDERTVRFAGFTLDLSARTLTGADGKEIVLTRTELDLLACLLAHKGRALSRDQILDEVWGREVVIDERTVDNFVSSLKKKLRWDDRSAWKILTVRGVGYRMEVDSP